MSDDQTIATLCKALSHLARVAILRHLLHVDRCIYCEIVNNLPLVQGSTICPANERKSMWESALLNP